MLLNLLKLKQHELEQKNPDYPFLLPKSYTKPFDYNYNSWFNDNLSNCSVQVRIFKLNLINGIKNSIQEF